MAVYRGDLAAAGSTITGMSEGPGDRARRDGAGLQPLASGRPGPPTGVTPRVEELPADGGFSSAAGAAQRVRPEGWVHPVAQWDGSSRPEVDQGLDCHLEIDDCPVSAFLIDRSTLPAGGSFEGADVASSLSIARWSGAASTPPRSGVCSVPYNPHEKPRAPALAVHDGSVCVGGALTRAGRKASLNIVCWDE